MKEQNRLFLNHSEYDTEKVKELRDRLKAKGFQTWMAGEDLHPGQDIDATFYKHVRKADFFLHCMSAKGLDSRGKYQKQLKKALDVWQEKRTDDIYLIPIRLDLCEIPPELDHIQYVDLFGETGFEKLLRALGAGMREYEKDMAVFPCRGNETFIRYFVHIEKREGRYAGRISLGDSDAYPPLENFDLGPEQTVGFGDRPVTLDEIANGIAEPKRDWLKKRMDEHGQYAIGRGLFHRIFGERKLSEIQPSGVEIDLRLAAEDSHILRLPWHLLADNSLFLAATEWSVGFSPPESGQTDCELPGSPKLLVAAPRPAGLGDTGADIHLDKLRDLLAAADSAYFQGGNLAIVNTWDEFKNAVKKFSPDLIYFYGSGTGGFYDFKLVFSDKRGRAIEKPVTELPALFNHGKVPALAFLNCCMGKAAGSGGAALQLAKAVPAVAANRVAGEEHLAFCMEQGIQFWHDIILKGLPPHAAVSRLATQTAAEIHGMQNARWAAPLLFSRYGKWMSHPPEPTTRLISDPHWRMKLDRVDQFGQVWLQVTEMFQERKPKTIAYLWYGEEGQGVDYFHGRLKVDLREKLDKAVMLPLVPEWPAMMDDPEKSFAKMMAEAFSVREMDEIPRRIRNFTRSVSGIQTLVYVSHRPVRLADEFHPKYIKSYLEWWNRNMVPLMRGKIHAVIGISYVSKKPARLLELFAKRLNLDNLLLSETMLQILKQLDRVKKMDLIRFIHTHNIHVPKDRLDMELDRIMDDTRGDYERTLDALLDLKTRAWHEEKDAGKKADGATGADDWDDVIG